MDDVTRLSGFLLLALAGCASAPSGPRPANVHPGFDLARFPGEDTLRAWSAASPYEWIGYYLPSPCHRDRSWVGTRPLIERSGLGTAVLYVGQQAFGPEPPSTGPATGPIICSRSLLTPEQGRTDAIDAAAQADAEGFPHGSIVFLNIERMGTVPDSMLAYYGAWVEEMLRDGRFLPGTYVHQVNTAVLYDSARAVYSRAGRSETPPFWVSSGSGFSLAKPPYASGLPYAAIWQGAFDVDRSWAGITLRVDENVASRPSPSAPRPPGG